jgi:hypothetical protein
MNASPHHCQEKKRKKKGSHTITKSIKVHTSFLEFDANEELVYSKSLKQS